MKSQDRHWYQVQRLRGMGWKTEPAAAGQKQRVFSTWQHPVARTARARVSQKGELRVGLKTQAGCQRLEQNHTSVDRRKYG